MYYPSSENTGADQLRGYREADLRLCFRIGNYPVFSRRGSYVPIPRSIFFHDAGLESSSSSSDSR